MTPSELLDQRIASFGDWRGDVMARLSAIVQEADPALTLEWKWDTAVWSRNGLVCAIGAFKDNVRVNFFKGANLPDPRGLFNAGLEAKATRAVRFNKSDTIDEAALKELIREATSFNTTGRS